MNCDVQISQSLYCEVGNHIVFLVTKLVNLSQVYFLEIGKV